MNRLVLVLCAALVLVACGDDGEGGAPVDAGVTDAARPSDAGLPEPLTSEPLSWTYVPFDETSCGNGDPLGLAVNMNPNDDRVLIFLEGGGWCWNAETCRAGNADVTTFTFSGVTETSVLDVIQREKRGIFDRTDPLNPFRDYNIVYVPYCTGDMHFGREASPGYPTAHVGALNMEAFLERIVPTFANASQVVLSGVSAGAYGALWNYHGVQTAFGDVPVHLLSDSGPALGAPAFPDELLSAFASRWGLEFPVICSTCSTLPELLAAVTAEHPARRQAFVVAEADLVLRQLFGRTPSGGLGSRVSVAAFADGVDVLTASLDSSAGAHPFTITTDQHVFVDKDLLNTAVGSTSIGQWLAAFEAGEPTWGPVTDDGDVFQFEPGSLGLSYGDPAADVAYAYPTDPAYGAQQDLRRVIVNPSGRALEVEIRTEELSNESGAARGFDTLALTIFIERPGEAGLAELPLLDATGPEDLRWSWMHRLSGTLNDVHTTEGASASAPGRRLMDSPAVDVVMARNAIRVTYQAPEGEGWEGARVFVTSWDVDSSGAYLDITPNAGPRTFGGAPGPRIMDDLPPIRVPSPISVADPSSDERYQYPTGDGFEGAGDLLGAVVRSSGGAISLGLQMREITALWNPPNGFDHVTFTLFFHHPDRPGSTALPFLNATMPDGLDWFAMARVHGFGNEAFGSDGAGTDTFGAPLQPVPQVVASAPARNVTLSFAQDLLGLPSLSGGKVFVTTWDFDGISGIYRELRANPGGFEYGGGQPNEPKLMDTLLIDLP
ncbi:MAG: pectin acetylesterase-family hydrolase [Myxococcota bacterium]